MGQNLASMEWAMRDSYYPTIKATPDQPVFGRDMLFNLASVKDWQVVTAVKQHQSDIDNVRGNARQVMHNHAIGYQVGVEMTGIYRKLDYKKQGPYKITEVFTKGTFRVQRGQVNENINIRRLKSKFDE